MDGPDQADYRPGKLLPHVARILRPLIRLLISSGVTFPVLSDLLRQLFVNVAERDFTLPGKEQTDSRIYLLTGIHRKEIRRLRGTDQPAGSIPPSLSRTSLILARWQASPEFLDAEGNPLSLPRSAENGPSFESLVGSVTRDVRSRAVLDEWLDRKLVRFDEADRITLLQTALIPASGDDRQLYYFARNLHDHMAAAVENIIAPSPQFLERAVHYDGLSQEVALSLQHRAQAMASTLLQKANKDAHRESAEGSDGRWRWNFGIYVFVEEAGSTKPAPGSEDS